MKKGAVLKVNKLLAGNSANATFCPGNFVNCRC